MTITLSKGGTAERTIEVESIQIPDLWHIGLAQADPNKKAAILECWHIAHDMRNALQERSKSHDALLAACQAMLPLVDGLWRRIGESDDCARTMNQARAAIALATGNKIATPAVSENLNQPLTTNPWPAHIPAHNDYERKWSR